MFNETVSLVTSNCKLRWQRITHSIVGGRGTWVEDEQADDGQFNRPSRCVSDCCVFEIPSAWNLFGQGV